MVHFSADLVQAYLRDTARVLKPRGMALYHDSNLPATTTLFKLLLKNASRARRI